ncbi:YqgE/AlgH family protein [Corynebacterium liangguodongii]|uniref:YqgE/AlgH family protein n=1 Tax=Corynebacterium liangguodongii TaxID=2079535 RepID=A0A2S0WGZ4_9CORY|nr:YqgE/AlgH family protein [Corynebacterium liangguodongii]AWB84952.1 YqgE/AlgH family protein [Corynebacterium liangguodongii]PWB99340.1 YqgE/AlgH family protein [Corynebacterium liangguodongii]
MADFFYADRLFNGLEREEPAAGMLLVSAPGMDSRKFVRTVVLLLEHSVRSSLGVVLNRRSDVAVHNALPQWLECVAEPQALYIGGPVSPRSAVGLGVTRPGVAIEDHAVLTRLANRLVQVDLRAEPAEVAPLLTGMRLFGGYAQWEPGQLDDEIERGDWFVVPALPSDVIAPAAADLWGDVMRRQAMPLPLYATFPADLEDN